MCYGRLNRLEVKSSFYVLFWTCTSLFWNNNCTSINETLETQIKSKLLAFGAVSTTLNDQGCQHVAGRFELIRMPLNKSDGWPTFVQLHLSVSTVD